MITRYVIVTIAMITLVSPLTANERLFFKKQRKYKIERDLRKKDEKAQLAAKLAAQLAKKKPIDRSRAKQGLEEQDYAIKLDELS